MTTSDTINEIASALAKAQAEMGGAVRDSANPFFKSKYPDLASVREACNGPLTKNGIAVVQSPSTEAAVVSVETTLMHCSGQWMRGVLTATAKDDSPQSVGSAITYLRRYALMSFAGVAPEDDDAEAAQGRPKAQRVEKPDLPEGYVAWLATFEGVADSGSEALRKAWASSDQRFRDYLTKWGGGTEPIKARAAIADKKAKPATKAVTA